MATTNQTIEIPQDKWSAYFTAFSDEYEGWACNIEVLSPELGDQSRIQGLPLLGISYEPKGGSQACDILIEAGQDNMPFETHLIRRPKSVRVAVTQPGAETDIEFESEEGYTTLVRLRPRRVLPDPDGRDTQNG